VGEDPFLADLSRQRLDRGASMLLLARVNNCLRTDLYRDPSHPRKFSRRDGKRQCLFAELDFQLKLAMFLVAVVHDTIGHNSGVEVR